MLVKKNKKKIKKLISIEFYVHIHAIEINGNKTVCYTKKSSKYLTRKKVLE